jgi:hypothetical protein
LDLVSQQTGSSGGKGDQDIDKLKLRFTNEEQY